MNQEQQTIINNFTNSLKDFDKVLEKVPDGGLDWAENEGEWTIRHVIHHLAGDCNAYVTVIERALATPGCRYIFGEFPGNIAWADRLAFGERPTGTAIELMHVHRTFLAELVSYFPDRWNNRVNFFNDEGMELATSTVKDMIVMLTEHMQEHTAMVEDILQAHLS